VKYYLYILHSKLSDRFYIGYSSNPWKRLLEHNTSLHNTYTSKHRPWVFKAIYFVSDCENKAIQIERFLKKQKSSSLIRRLIEPSFEGQGILAQLVRVPHMRDTSRGMRD
jgi:putative endonuclease